MHVRLHSAWRRAAVTLSHRSADNKRCQLLVSRPAHGCGVMTADAAMIQRVCQARPGQRSKGMQGCLAVSLSPRSMLHWG